MFYLWIAQVSRLTTELFFHLQDQRLHQGKMPFYTTVAATARNKTLRYCCVNGLVFLLFSVRLLLLSGVNSCVLSLFVAAEGGKAKRPGRLPMKD